MAPIRLACPVASHLTGVLRGGFMLEFGSLDLPTRHAQTRTHWARPKHGPIRALGIIMRQPTEVLMVTAPKTTIGHGTLLLRGICSAT